MNTFYIAAGLILFVCFLAYSGMDGIPIVILDDPCHVRADSLETALADALEELRWIAVQDSVRSARDKIRVERMLGGNALYTPPTKMVGPRLEEE